MADFHVGGFDAYCKALKQELESRIAALREKRKLATSKSEEEQIDQQIQEEYQLH